MLLAISPPREATTLVSSIPQQSGSPHQHIPHQPLGRRQVIPSSDPYTPLTLYSRHFPHLKPSPFHSPINHVAASVTHSIAHAAHGHHLVQISLAPFHPGSFKKKISADYIKGFIRFLLSWVHHIIQMVSKENCYLLIARVAASYQMSGFCCL